MSKAMIKLKEVVHNKYLDYRSIDYKINTEQIEKLYEELSLDEQLEFDKLAISGQWQALSDKIRRYMEVYEELESKTVEQLRRLARQYKIPNYIEMPKPVLYNSIKKEVEKCQKK